MARITAEVGMAKFTLYHPTVSGEIWLSRIILVIYCITALNIKNNIYVFVCLFDLILNVQVNNFSVMSGRVFLVLN